MIIYDRKMQDGGKPNALNTQYGIATGINRNPYVADTESTYRQQYIPAQQPNPTRPEDEFIFNSPVQQPEDKNISFIRKILGKGVEGLGSLYDGLSYWANAGK